MKTASRLLALLFGASLFGAAGCASKTTGELSQSGVDNDGDGDIDRDDCKIENEEIGVVGLSLDLGSKTVTFESWLEKEDSPGEFVGFTLSLAGGDTISYRVKSGGEVVAVEGLSFVNPNGTSGPDASGISNVDFCDEVDEDDGEDGDGDEGGAAVCGNDAVELGEQCDDGNTADGDGCSSACQAEQL
jgi:cysteine-rich repeat protein